MCEFIHFSLFLSSFFFFFFFSLSFFPLKKKNLFIFLFQKEEKKRKNVNPFYWNRHFSHSSADDEATSSLYTQKR